MSEMFYGASPEIFARARSLRQNMTEFELKIWELLKNKYQDYEKIIKETVTATKLSKQAP